MEIQKIRHHVQTMKEKHDALDKEITEDYKNYVDDLTIERKKKEKLALKDEIEKYIRTIE